MGAIYKCKICGEQAKEFEEIDGEAICQDCQDDALTIGIKFLKHYRRIE